MVVIELLFCSQYQPEGINLTIETCLLMGVGFMFLSIIFSLAYLMFVEFPLSRMLQYTVLQHVTHDRLLAEKFMGTP